MGPPCGPPRLARLFSFFKASPIFCLEQKRASSSHFSPLAHTPSDFSTQLIIHRTPTPALEVPPHPPSRLPESALESPNPPLLRIDRGLPPPYRHCSVSAAAPELKPAPPLPKPAPYEYGHSSSQPQPEPESSSLALAPLSLSLPYPFIHRLSVNSVTSHPPALQLVPSGVIVENPSTPHVSVHDTEAVYVSARQNSRPPTLRPSPQATALSQPAEAL